MREAGRCHLARLTVKPSARGQGYGETLVRGLYEVGRLRGCERLSLNVAAGNVPAITLYLKLGFVDAPRPPSELDAATTRYLERPA
jgi:ribosomal protein S18 acetylase RimI-like enzyme